jgi:putative transposase
MAFPDPGNRRTLPLSNRLTELFRAERLNAHWFTSLKEAQRMVQTWRGEYDERRPYRALGEKASQEFAKEIAISLDFLGIQTAENPR